MNALRILHRLERESMDLRRRAGLLRTRSDAPSHQLARRLEIRATYLEYVCRGYRLDHPRDKNPNLRRINTLAVEAFMDAAHGTNTAEFLRSWMEEKKGGAAVTTPPKSLN